jgi:dTDP-4-amino-4,6-dideoxygalactose transaminase
MGFFDGREVVPVASGAAALHLALLSLNLQHGDEVIIPALAQAGLPTLVALAGGRPVLADIIAVELPVLDPADVEARLTPATRAIVVAHRHGHPAPLRELLRMVEAHHLKLIEDCTCALGARLGGQLVGTFGQLGVFALQGQPDGGGLITCADVAQRRQLEGLRSSAAATDDNGLEHSLDITLSNGYRIDEAAAAAGIRRLAGLEEELLQRRQLLAQARRDAEAHGLQTVFADGSAEIATSADETVAFLAENAQQRATLSARLAGLGLVVRQPHALHHAAPFSHQLPRPALPRADEYCSRAIELPVTPDLERLADL